NNQQLIFEVRGLVTPRKRGVDVGNIFHCANGYMVMPTYNRASAYDLDGNPIRSWDGPDSHYGNWVSAIRSRRHQDLNGDILEGHLSSALCHLGNISYRLGRAQPFEPRQNVFGDSAAAQNTMVVMEEHLAENRVALNETNLMVGRRLAVDPTNENFPNDQEANAMLTRQYRQGFVVPASV